MNYNPYAPPQAAPPAPSADPATGDGTPQPWAVGEVLSEAFERFKANWTLLVPATAVLAVLVYGSPYALRYVPIPAGDLARTGLPIASRLATMVSATFFEVGYVRMLLVVARGGRPGFGALFSGGDRFLAMCVTRFFLTVAVVFGMLLFLVPGVVLWCGLGLSWFFVIDQRLGPINALKASYAATEGHKMNLFVLGVTSIAILIGAVLACAVPVFAAVPVLVLAMTIVYLRITGRGVARVPAFSGPPGYGPAGGGYRPPGY